MSAVVETEPEVRTSSDLPEGWAVTILGEIGDYLNGRAFKASEWSRSGRPIIRIQDLTGSKSKPNFFKGRVEERYVVLPGDFLISWAATLGAYIWAGPEGVLNQHIFKVHSKIDQKFHYYLANRILEELYQHTHGSGMVHITKGRFDNIPVPIPPLAEQKRVVKKVEALLVCVNAARERLAKAPAILKRFRQTVLAAACSGRLTKDWRVLSGSSEEGELPDTWRSIDAGEAYVDARYGTSMKCDRNQKGVPVLRVPNIAAGIINLSDLKYASFTKKELVSLAVREGDIVICRTNGSLELIGKAAVIPKLDREYTFASYLIRVRVDGAILLPRYFHVFLSSPLGRDIIEELARSTAGQFNLNLEILRNLPIPLPPLDEQHEIVHRVEALFKLADAIEKRIAAATIQADKLTQAILAKAFRGELALTEAELARREGRDYETAAQLLARIKAERDTGATSKPACSPMRDVLGSALRKRKVR